MVLRRQEGRGQGETVSITKKEAWEFTKAVIGTLIIVAGVVTAFYFAHAMGW